MDIDKHYKPEVFNLFSESKLTKMPGCKRTCKVQRLASNLNFTLVGNLHMKK